MQARTTMARVSIITSLVSWLAFAALTSVSPAHAQELTEAGTFSLGAERLFGFYVGKETVDVGPANATKDFTDLSLGWHAAPTPLTQPRLALDYFVDEHLTLGGSFGVFSLNTDVGAGNVSVTGVLFGLRAGYALRLSHAISFWPRAGFTYSTVNSDVNATDRHLLSLGLEGLFALSPAEGWAVLLGPIIDLGFSGKSAGNDLTENCFGLMAGLLGYFGS